MFVLQASISEDLVLGANTETTLQSILLTCLFLAAKMSDQVHALGLLRCMLTGLTQGKYAVTARQAADVEERCLITLDWRLGPYFAEDDLDDPL
jgi:hypothetical protein